MSEAADIASPCVNICRMDEASGACRGCFRTLDEIAEWAEADAHRRIAILAAVDKRRRELDPWGETLRGECVR